MNRALFIIPATALALFCAFAPVCLGAEELTEKDQTELTVLYKKFHNNAHLADYPALLDDLSLRRLMSEHRSYLSTLAMVNGEKKLAKYFTFKPDLDTILDEKDPLKYFAGIDVTAETGQGLPAPLETKIVGIAGDRERAYIVVEMPPEKGQEEAGPEYTAVPAILTDKGWRIDGSTTIVRAIRRQNKQLKEAVYQPNR